MNMLRVLLVAVAFFMITGLGLNEPLGFAKTSNEDAKQTQLAKACGKCGDGQCVKQCGETPTSCPRDCGISSPSVKSSKAAACGKCGDGQCVKQCGETATSCPKDCGGSGVPSITKAALASKLKL
jgi:hypothetical protein